MPITREDDHALENFVSHEDEKFLLEEQDIEMDHNNLVDEGFDNRSCATDGLSGHTP